MVEPVSSGTQTQANATDAQSLEDAANEQAVEEAVNGVITAGAIGNMLRSVSFLKENIAENSN